MWMWIRVSVHKHLKYLSNWDSSYNAAWRCMCSSIALCHLLLLSVFPGLSLQDNHPEGNWKPGKLPSSRATWLTVVWEVSCTFRIFCESQPNLDFLGCIYIYTSLSWQNDTPQTTQPKPFTTKNAKHETWVEASCQQSRTRKDMCTWGTMVWNFPRPWFVESLEANVGQEIIESWVIFTTEPWRQIATMAWWSSSFALRNSWASREWYDIFTENPILRNIHLSKLHMFSSICHFKKKLMKSSCGFSKIGGLSPFIFHKLSIILYFCRHSHRLQPRRTAQNASHEKNPHLPFKRAHRTMSTRAVFARFWVRRSDSLRWPTISSRNSTPWN